MKNKSRKTLPKTTLKEFVIVPITDPAEQAALDRRCRQAEKVLSAAGPDSRKSKSSKPK
jgi:7,8-dihydro-6-hydroxymethylpterin-pyrophosphokinase